MKNSHDLNRRCEFTLQAFILGMVLSLIMGAANAYLGLYAGMTVSASIPAAVISMGILRGILKRGSIYENNIVQTMASSGESLAAGIIFTIPALIITSQWQDFRYWPTTLTGLAGGLIGVVFMIPLRKVLIVEGKDLKYPEGVACAQVLSAGQTHGSGLLMVVLGIAGGGFFKFLSSGLELFKTSIEHATRLGGRVVFAGMEASPALVGVGYIIELRVAFLVFMGGFIAWNVVLPFIPLPDSLMEMSPVDAAYAIWSTKIRYIGVGAMIAGGVFSIYSIRSGIRKSIRNLKSSIKEAGVDGDLSPKTVMGLTAALIPIVFLLYTNLIDNVYIAALATILMVVFSFFFAAVSSYIVGLVGSSNNPVSGMTICALIGTALFLWIAGVSGDSAVASTLGVAAIVCCAACAAGDISQDLKTGHLIGATPKWQQVAQLAGVTGAAFVLAPVLSVLHHAYGIGKGLKAPQATLFASIAESFRGDTTLPYPLIFGGLILGIIIIAADQYLSREKKSFRLHLMPIAVGIYLPLTLSAPIFLGGIARYFADRHLNRPNGEENRGLLLSSGLIAGEAITGILLAVLIYFGISIKIPLKSTLFELFREWTTLTVLAALILWLALTSRFRK